MYSPITKEKMTEMNKDLPENEATLLRDLRAGGTATLPALRARVAALRDAGWTLVAVGRPLGANRSTTRMWQLTAKPEDVEEVKKAGVPHAPLKIAPARTIRLYPDVPPAELAELQRLAESARTVRGSTPQDSQARKDAREFEAKLQHYVERGVPMKRLAERLGVTHRAVAARLERAKVREMAAAS